MSLIKCYECGQSVSTEATSCPHCGAVKKKSRQSSCLTTGCMFAVCVYVASLAVTSLLPATVNNAPKKSAPSKAEDNKLPELATPALERKEKTDTLPTPADSHVEKQKDNPSQQLATRSQYEKMDVVMLKRVVEKKGALIVLMGAKIRVEREKADENSRNRTSSAFQILELKSLEADFATEKKLLADAEEWLRKKKELESPNGSARSSSKAPADLEAVNSLAVNGKQIIKEIMKRNPTIDPFYGDLDTASSTLALPKQEWDKLTESERKSIASYLLTQSPYWKIVVGRISPDGRDVYSDTQVMTSADWNKK